LRSKKSKKRAAIFSRSFDFSDRNLSIQREYRIRNYAHETHERHENKKLNRNILSFFRMFRVFRGQKIVLKQLLRILIQY